MNDNIEDLFLIAVMMIAMAMSAAITYWATNCLRDIKDREEKFSSSSRARSEDL